MVRALLLLATLTTVGCDSRSEPRPRSNIDLLRPGRTEDPKPDDPSQPSAAAKHPDFPTPLAAGTDKIFTTEEPDRGPKVPHAYTASVAGLTWTEHAYCEPEVSTYACTKAKPHGLKKWREGKSPTLIVLENWRAGRLDDRYVYEYTAGKPRLRVVIDSYGDVTEMNRFTGDKYDGRKPSGQNALAGCGAKTFTIEDGKVAQISCKQWTGDPMRDTKLTAAYRYVRNNENFITKRTSLALDGKPLAGTDGIAHAHYDRDAEGRIATEMYRDASDAPVAAESGCFGLAYTRDENGDATRTTCLDGDAKPHARTAGYTFTLSKFDARGCLTEDAYYNADRTRNSDDGVHANVYVTDEFCANIKETCLGGDRKPNGCTSTGPASHTYTRDRHGRVIVEKYYDTFGIPAMDPRGEAVEIRSLYDDVGRLIGTDCYDADGDLSICDSTDATGDRFGYNAAGLISEATYTGMHKEPITNLGIAKRVFRYDNYDHQFEVRDYKLDGSEIRMRRDLWDSAHRHFGIVYYDATAKPTTYDACFVGATCPDKPWHAVRIMRRSDGVAEHNKFFDLDGNMIQETDCGAVPCFDVD